MLLGCVVIFLESQIFGDKNGYIHIQIGNGGFPIFCGREAPCRSNHKLGGAICGSIGLEGSDL